jgi:hypothetical protein
MVVDHLSGWCEAPGLAYVDVDHLCPWCTISLMEKSSFTMTNLSSVRVIMAIMHVPMGE